MMYNYAPIEPTIGNTTWQEIMAIYSESDSTEYGGIFSYPAPLLPSVQEITLPSSAVDQGEDEGWF